MGNKPRPKMPIKERAKQFAPFAAIKGLEKALREKEKNYDAKIELSDEYSDMLNDMILQLHKGTKAIITHYKDEQYTKSFGQVTKIDKENKSLTINRSTIYFRDIINIQIDEESEG